VLLDFYGRDQIEFVNTWEILGLYLTGSSSAEMSDRSRYGWTLGDVQRHIS
jgi:hypothetical protein